ncbi:MAG: oligosaccharide flippase family protein [Chitinophagaceae bacterium]|nr:oligosaccharide flippase family protein [Chitinophagaceae bacterium]
MGFKKVFIKNILISGSFTYLSQAITFFSTIIISRYLGPESYGFVGIITIFTRFLNVFADSGMSLAVIRSDFLYTYHKSVDTLALLLGVVLCVMTCLLAFPLSVFFRTPGLVLPMMVMSLSFIFKSMTLVRSALITKNMDFRFSGYVTLMTALFTAVATILMAHWGAGYWSLVIPQTFSSLVTLFFLEKKIRFKFHLYSWAHVKVSFRHTRKTIGNLMGFNMVNYWSRNLDNLLVGRMYGAADLGIYNRGYNLLTFPLALITGLITAVLYPSLNKLKHSAEAIRTEYLSTLRMIGFISFPVSCILLLFNNQLVRLFWGEAWMGVAQLLPYFGLLLLSQSLSSTVGNMLVLIKREEVLRISGWLSAVAIIAGIVYGAFHSLVSIAQFYSLAFIVLVLPLNLFYIFVHTMKFPLKTMLLFWGPNILFSLAIWFTCYYGLGQAKLLLLVAFFLTMLLNARSEISQIFVLLRVQYKVYANR